MIHLMFISLFACSDSETKSTETPKAKPETNEQAADKTPTQRATKEVSEPKKTADSKVPDRFDVHFKTTQGDILLEVHRDWSPNGADRFYELVKSDYYTDIAFFRAIGGFMIQFGIHGDPKISANWRDQKLPDDPVKQSNTPGYMSYAMAGPGTRTTQMFINLGNNQRLDSMGFAPFAKVSEENGGGMAVVKKIYTGYGEGAPNGRGPNQGLVQMQGNEYLKSSFPKLDYILSARVCGEGTAPADAPTWCK